MVSLRRRVFQLIAVSLLAGLTLPSSAGDLPRVSIKTSMGDMELELYPEKAPKTVENFLQYVKDGFYNGTIFHRVIFGFMIQGGGFDVSLNEKETRNPIKHEGGRYALKNEQYTIAMARTREPDSASAQFFINAQENRFLNWPGQDGWGYVVFGKVTRGTEVVDRIQAVKTSAQGLPNETVLIHSVSVLD